MKHVLYVRVCSESTAVTSEHGIVFVLFRERGHEVRLNTSFRARIVGDIEVAPIRYLAD